jgi:hypothetical protein
MRKLSILAVACLMLGVLVVTVSCSQASSALCSKETQDYLDRIEPLHDEFVDTAELADSTPRIALSPVIQDMQRIAREIEDQAAPDCAADARTQLIGGMDLVIDGYIGFMSEEDDEWVTRDINNGIHYMNKAIGELTDLALGKAP